jgi:phospholipid transport system substrate-binding protein
MAEKVLGRQWGELSEEDRRRWREVFAELLTATYAGRFVGYRGQQFETRGEEAAARDTVLVLTRLVDPKGDDVDIDYRLRRADRGWRVVDVYLKGTVSELALRRSEYSAVLARQGFSALLDAVRAKIGALERGEDK